MDRPYPKMLYKPNGRVLEHRVVNDENDHADASRKGWLVLADAQAKLDDAGDTHAVAAENDKISKQLFEAKASFDKAQAMLASKNERIAQLETFLAAVAADEAAPPALIEAISELGIVVEAKAKPKASDKADKASDKAKT